MALIQKISNYLNFGKQRNFSEQTNFDAGRQPSTSEEAARKSGYSGRIKSDDTTKVAKSASVPTSNQNQVQAPAPKAQETASKTEQSELSKFNEQRQAAMEKQGKQIVAQVSGAAKNAGPKTKAEPTKVADKESKFVAERGSLKAKKTENYIPFDKSDKATGHEWKNAAGQTVKLYEDKDGTKYIRGPQGKVAIFDNKGQVLPSAKNYRKLTSAFADMIQNGAGMPVRQKDTAGVTKIEKPTIDTKKMQAAMKAQYDANGNRIVGDVFR